MPLRPPPARPPVPRGRALREQPRAGGRDGDAPGGLV